MVEIPIEMKKEDFGIGLLQTISQGLYEDPAFVIREYVQNSFDANATEIWLTPRYSEGFFSIIDNGVGMGKNEMLNLRKIGVSEKPQEKVGFRGIGRWAGLFIADTIKIISGKAGENKKYFFTVDAKRIRKQFHTGKPLIDVLEKERTLILEEENKSPETYGTEVILELIPEVLEKIEKDEDKIKITLRNILPIEFDKRFPHKNIINHNIKSRISEYKCCTVKWKGEDLYRPPTGFDELESPLFYDIEHNNDKLGFVWICCNKETQQLDEVAARGLQLRLKNFGIGTREKWAILFPKSRRLLYPWITGEIFVTNPNIFPNAARDGLEDSNEQRILLEKIGNILSEINNKLGKKSAIDNAERVIRREINKFQKLKTDVEMMKGTERYDKRAMIISKIAKIKEEIEKRKTNLFDEVLKEEVSRIVPQIDELQLDILGRSQEKEAKEIKVEKRIAPKEMREDPASLFKNLIQGLKIDKKSKNIINLFYKTIEEELDKDTLVNILKKFKEKLKLE